MQHGHSAMVSCMAGNQHSFITTDNQGLLHAVELTIAEVGVLV